MTTLPAKKRGRPRKNIVATGATGTGLSPDVKELVLTARNKMNEQYGFQLSLADTVRHLVHLYLKGNTP